MIPVSTPFIQWSYQRSASYLSSGGPGRAVWMWWPKMAAFLGTFRVGSFMSSHTACMNGLKNGIQQLAVYTGTVILPTLSRERRRAQKSVLVGCSSWSKKAVLRRASRRT
ncbi:MAG: hypothetical protein OZX49_02559 [Immundisolibacter sp.]|nr:hypothetical protein [Immundisolibacter sp.]